MYPWNQYHKQNWQHYPSFPKDFSCPLWYPIVPHSLTMHHIPRQPLIWFESLEIRFYFADFYQNGIINDVFLSSLFHSTQLFWNSSILLYESIVHLLLWLNITTLYGYPTILKMYSSVNGHLYPVTVILSLTNRNKTAMSLGVKYLYEKLFNFYG